MEDKQHGNQKLPDFDQLNDRLIANRPSEPMLVIKTNLDPQDVTENNPYYHNGEIKTPKKFKNFFEE